MKNRFKNALGRAAAVGTVVLAGAQAARADLETDAGAVATALGTHLTDVGSAISGNMSSIMLAGAGLLAISLVVRFGKRIFKAIAG